MADPIPRTPRYAKEVADKPNSKSKESQCMGNVAELRREVAKGQKRMKSQTSIHVSEVHEEEDEEPDEQQHCNMLLPLEGNDRVTMMNVLKLFEASKTGSFNTLPEMGIRTYVRILIYNIQLARARPYDLARLGLTPLTRPELGGDVE